MSTLQIVQVQQLKMELSKMGCACEIKIHGGPDKESCSDLYRRVQKEAGETQILSDKELRQAAMDDVVLSMNKIVKDSELKTN